MIATLTHNPRVLAAPDDPVPTEEVERLLGSRRPPIGAWVVKLEGLAEGQATELSRAASANAGQVWHRLADGATVVRLPADRVEASCAALGPDASLAAVAEAIRATLEAWQRATFTLKAGGRGLEVGRRTLLMGVVNVTPDSFSDGGKFLDPAAAIDHGKRLVREGADLLDIGGESTRPGAESVDAELECVRVLPVVEALARDVGVPLSIDTSKAAVARRAVEAGATMLNDITALRGDPEMARVAAESGLPLVLMHMQGTPRSMQRNPQYDDLMRELVAYLRRSMALAVGAGVREEQILTDPGIGFGKTVDHNLEILRRLPELRSLGRPILVGTSRKSLIGALLNVPVGERLLGTAATVSYGIARGAHLVRVHDVAAMRQVAQMTDAMVGRPQDSAAGPVIRPARR